MEKNDLLAAFSMLGAKLPFDFEIVVAGGSALLLQDFEHRGTTDCDTIASNPGLESIRRYVEEVAEAMDLSPAWLNDGAKSYAEVLPANAPDSFEEVGQYGRLHVRHIGRSNLILMKLTSLRPVDMDDLEAIKPTVDEIECARRELARVGRLNAPAAMKMDLYLKQGGRTRK
jgi:hypothetical protein